MYEGWTPEREALLREMWTAGKTATQIAERLGGGITRNAVIGKKNRLGLHESVARRRHTGNGLKTLAKARKVRAERRAAKAAKPPRHGGHLPPQMWPPPSPLPERQADDIARVSFTDLGRGHCRYIPGEPRGHPLDSPMYCGLPTVDGAPYCAGHLRRCHNDPPPRFAPTRPAFHDSSEGHSVFGKSRERV
jgi:GcrA cell cycle regulator